MIRTSITGRTAGIQTLRPQDNIALEGNMFKGKHDLKFGFGWRKASVTSESGWPGNGVRTYLPRLSEHAGARRSRLGARWRGQLLERVPRRHHQLRSADDQCRRALGSIGELGARRVGSCQPGASRSAAGADRAGIENAIVYNNVTPRVGFTYALNESRKTILRGSYAAFASQLDSNRAAITVSAIPYYSYVYYAAVDTNGNRIADVSEFTNFQGVAGFDPDNPLGGNPDKIGNYSSPLDARAPVRHRARARSATSASRPT